MNSERFTEADFEQTLIELFQGMGYQYECGYDVERDFREPYYTEDLKRSLRKMNPLLSDDVLDEAFRIITHVNEGTLEQRNERMMDYLQSGVEVKHSEDGRPCTALVRLVNFDNPLQNDFKICNQWRVVEHDVIRCDLVAFVNGLPMVVIELKSPANDNVEEDDAYLQIKQYQQKCPSLFVYNAFSVTSDMLTSKAGTITAKENRFMEWKSVDGKSETSEIADYETFFHGIFEKARLIDILQNFVCFDHKDGRLVKIMGAYHQYFAVRKAVERTKIAVNGETKMYDKWYDFRRYILEPAMKEINEKTDIHVDYKLEKGSKGGKVQSIVFILSKNKNYIEEKPEPEPSEVTLAQLIALEEFMEEPLSTSSKASLIKAANGDLERIRQAYYFAKQQPEVRNLVGFMVSALKGNYEGEEAIPSMQGVPYEEAKVLSELTKASNEDFLNFQKRGILPSYMKDGQEIPISYTDDEVIDRTSSIGKKTKEKGRRGTQKKKTV